MEVEVDFLREGYPQETSPDYPLEVEGVEDDPLLPLTFGISQQPRLVHRDNGAHGTTHSPPQVLQLVVQWSQTELQEAPVTQSAVPTVVVT